MIASEHERFDEANALYERAMNAWPGNYASLANWASLLWDESRRVGAKAMQLRRDGRIAESDALTRQADAGFQQAVEKINRAVAMMPSYPHAHLVRAMILESYVRDSDGAIAEFQEVLRLDPNHPQRALIESEMQRLRTR
jgi:tetratricopeptide (TPR) repeat protein